MELVMKEKMLFLIAIGLSDPLPLLSLSKIYHWNYQTTIFYYVVQGTGASKKSATSCLVLQDYIYAMILQ